MGRFPATGKATRTRAERAAGPDYLFRRAFEAKQKHMNTISQFTDEELMKGIQTEKPECLAELYYRHSSILRGVIFHVLHDHFEADDVLQETFMEIWIQAKAFSPEKGQPLGWMITMTRRRSIDRLRKREAYMRLKERFLNEPKP